MERTWHPACRKELSPFMHVMTEVASFAVQRDRRESSETCIDARMTLRRVTRSIKTRTDTPDKSVQVITSSTDKHTLSNRFDAMMIENTWCLVLLCGFYGRQKSQTELLREVSLRIEEQWELGEPKRRSIHFRGLQFPPFLERLSVYNLRVGASDERRREEIMLLLTLWSSLKLCM